MSNKPITARIKRTTKGGMVTQPLLNMGSPVKMKMSSPAKLDVDPVKEKQLNFRNEMARQSKEKANNLAASKAKVAAKNKSNYQTKADQYRKDVSTLGANMKSSSRNLNAKQMEAGMKSAGRQSKRIKSFEKELYDYDSKNKPGSTKGYTAKQYAMAKTSGTYKSKAKTTTSSDGGNKTKKGSYVKKGGKATGSMKNYKIGSKERYNEYAARGWKQDATTKGGAPSKPKVKKVEKIKGKQVAATTKTKLDPKVVKAQVKKVNTKKETSSKAAKIRAKGNAVLADKSLTTAQRQKQSKKLRRKYDRVTAKDIKKKERKERNPKYDPATGTGGSVAGNLLRSITGERRRDRKAAQQRKKSQASKAINPD